jgi:hypothetical protein
VSASVPEGKEPTASPHRLRLECRWEGAQRTPASPVGRGEAASDVKGGGTSRRRGRVLDHATLNASLWRLRHCELMRAHRELVPELEATEAVRRAATHGGVVQGGETIEALPVEVAWDYTT